MVDMVIVTISVMDVVVVVVVVIQTLYYQHSHVIVHPDAMFDPSFFFGTPQIFFSILYILSHSLLSFNEWFLSLVALYKWILLARIRTYIRLFRVGSLALEYRYCIVVVLDVVNGIHDSWWREWIAIVLLPRCSFRVVRHNHIKKMKNLDFCNIRFQQIATDNRYTEFVDRHNWENFRV